MNFCSFVGRFTAGFFAQVFGVANMIVVATGACAAVILGMLGLHSVVSVVLIGVTFGLFAGACKFHILFVKPAAYVLPTLQISLSWHH